MSVTCTEAKKHAAVPRGHSCKHNVALNIRMHTNTHTYIKAQTHVPDVLWPH